MDIIIESMHRTGINGWRIACGRKRSLDYEVVDVDFEIEDVLSAFPPGTKAIVIARALLALPGMVEVELSTDFNNGIKARASLPTPT